MNKTFFTAFLSFVFCVFGLVSSASADDYGVHNKYDVKVKMVDSLSLRASPELFFTNDSGGLQQFLFRAGPSLKVVPWLTLGINGFVGKTVVQDAAVEPQVELTPSLGSLRFSDRSRLGLRPLDTAAGNRWRYANELKVSWDSDSCSWVPFVSDEVFLSSKDVVYQNFAMVGLGYKWQQNRVDVGYMLRHEDAKTQWLPSHFVYLAVTSNQ